MLKRIQRIEQNQGTCQLGVAFIKGLVVLKLLVACIPRSESFLGNAPLTSFSPQQRRMTAGLVTRRRLSSIGLDNLFTSSPTDSKNASSPPSSIISTLAECALQLRLRSHSGVSCQVSADPTRMLVSGSVGPVTVKGRSWMSPLGLTCRAIEATVESCQLDLMKVLRDRKLRLTVPAKGKALVAFNSQDFGNFITYPLLKSQISKRIMTEFQFLKDNIAIDAMRNHVTFYGKSHDGTLYKCILSRSANSGASVQVYPSSSTQDTSGNTATRSQELATNLTRFFNQLVLELDGTYLNFHDFRINASRSSGSDTATLVLALSIEVHKLPSRGSAF
jgi:hypothetical protein